MKYKYVIWDWNGTILDDVIINFETVNYLLKKRNVREMKDLDEYRKKYCFPIIEFYHRLGFDLENEDFDCIADDYIKEYLRLFPTAKLFDSAKETFRKIKDRGITQLIVSASEKTLLHEQVVAHGLDSYFTDLLGTGDYRASSKAQLAENWLRDNKVNPKDVIFIGDSTHDYEVAQKNGCNCILVASGHNGRKELETLGVKVVENIAEVADWLL